MSDATRDFDYYRQEMISDAVMRDAAAFARP
jgi:hypothetical protein